jgi:hypothetical protein
MVGAHGPKLIANNRAATFFDRCVHEGLLDLALVAPDHLTYRLFDDVERQKLTIRVPLNYEEGCSIEPPYEGYWYARRSNLEKLPAILVTPVARAEAELAPARTSPAEPAESPRVESGRDVDAADAPVQRMQVKQLPSAASEATKKRRRKRKRKRRRKQEAIAAYRNPTVSEQPPPRPPNNAPEIEHVVWAVQFLRITDPGKLAGLRGKKLHKVLCKTVGSNFSCNPRTFQRGIKRADSM